MSNNAIKDKLFEFAYKMAFLDATMRNAFQKWEDESEESFHERKKVIRMKSMPIVRDYIDDIFNGKVVSSESVCDVIISLCDNREGFTFGNAQKLANMTAKYMYLSAYINDNMRGLFQHCHCPMDGVMLRRLKKELPCIECNTELSWSKLKYVEGKIPEEYLQFQENIKELAKKAELEDKAKNIIPIEVDYLYWED